MKNYLFRTFGFGFIIMVITLLGACNPGDPTADLPTSMAMTPTSQARLTILALGDSLTEGFGVNEDENYPSQLENKLREDGFDVRVINGGISGETSSATLSRLDWMLKTNPDIVIVEIGGNDALRGIDLNLTRKNIDEIVGKFTESGAVVVVAGLQIIQNLGIEYTTEFTAIYPTIAEKHNAVLIPFMLEGVAANPELNQADFIHPNANGYAVMVDHIYAYILEAIDLAEKRNQ
jgi:acyl-CoA thioesterase-1